METGKGRARFSTLPIFRYYHGICFCSNPLPPGNVFIILITIKLGYKTLGRASLLHSRLHLLLAKKLFLCCWDRGSVCPWFHDASVLTFQCRAGSVCSVVWQLFTHALISKSDQFTLRNQLHPDNSVMRRGAEEAGLSSAGEVLEGEKSKGQRDPWGIPYREKKDSCGKPLRDDCHYLDVTWNKNRNDEGTPITVVGVLMTPWLRRRTSPAIACSGAEGGVVEGTWFALKCFPNSA